MGNFDVPGVPGEDCWRLIGGRVGDFCRISGSLILAGALAGLGFGVGAVRVGGSWLVHQCSARAGVPRSVLARFGWSRSLCLGWPGLCSGSPLRGVWWVSLLCCWPDDGTSFWDTRYIHTFKIL